MAKKYLSLEEAAQTAGVSVDQLKQLRERGDIRGFSDGGTWKFKADDIEELRRSNEADSDPDVPLLTDEDLESDSSIIGMEEEDLVSEQPTVIRGSSALDDDDEDAFMIGTSSDSDVQLIPNELLTDVGGSGMISLGDSDSDVRLIDVPSDLPSSDSDVKLVGGSDSDVQIVGGSDSDVAIVDDGSDSDVNLVDDAKTEQDIPVLEDSDSDVALVKPDSGLGSEINLAMGDTDGSVFDDDESGISLGDGSSITLAADSGISLEKIDSDLSLQDSPPAPPKTDSDIGLEFDDDESGISLDGFDDSGIALMGDDDDDDGGFLDLADDSGIELSPADSGIALESLADSGIALDDDDDDNRTMPMVAGGGGLDDYDDSTAMDVPTLDDESEFELSMGDSDDDANVIMFDGEDDVDDFGATVVKKSGEVSEEFDLTSQNDFEMEDTFDEFESDDDGFDDDEFEAAGDFEDDLDVADDVVGHDDDGDDLDVFEDGADDFEDDFDAGTSSPDFVNQPASYAKSMPAPVQTEWGAGPFVGLLFATLLMAVCGMMMFDLVRSMWSWNDPSNFNSPLLGFVKDMIK